jgi:Ni2+-binding GTPase involved in maturation of urease and hydrogenase
MDIVEHMRRTKEIKRLQYNRKIITIDGSTSFKYFPLIQVVSSDLAAGVGKSTIIHNQCKRLGDNYNYIYFPVGGEFTKETLVDRLLQVKLEPPKKTGVGSQEYITNIHLDLTTTKLIELLKEFLFEFLILRFVKAGEKVFYLNNKVYITVELPYGFFPFEDQYTILKQFGQAKVKKENPPPLIVDSDPSSNMQIVCNYLLAFKTKDIDKHDIIMKDKQGNIILPSINDEECGELLKEFFEYVKNPTYFQFTIFINILADQFKKLSDNPTLKIQELKNAYKKINKQTPQNIRSIIIKNFITLTKYFTKGAYDEIVNQQKVTSNFFTSLLLNQDQINSKEADALINPSLAISYDNIEESLVFVNEDGKTITIIPGIKTSKEEREQLRLLFIANKFLLEPKCKVKDIANLKLTEYAQLSKDQYLLELNNISGINKQLEELQRLTTNYEITSDNFIKMVLILMRTRCKIPVILMGETGCGKTALLKYMVKLRGHTMHVLNIHAGIVDQDIVDFIEKKNLIQTEVDNTKDTPTPHQGVANKKDTAKSLQEKLQELHQEWVFLDEVNTCNSMGLVTELMTKRTMLGKPLKENVIVVAACNPYQKIDSKIITKADTGLVQKKEHTVRILVYNVNPLPHSLLNFVLNFGSLKPADEKKYIECMFNDAIVETVTIKRNEFKTQARIDIIMSKLY